MALSEADFLDPPVIEPQTWHDTFNETYVRFTNRLKKFKEDSVAYRDRGNYVVTGAITTQQLTRDWVTRQTVASKIAWACGRAAAIPLAAG